MVEELCPAWPGVGGAALPWWSILPNHWAGPSSTMWPPEAPGYLSLLTVCWGPPGTVALGHLWLLGCLGPMKESWLLAGWCSRSGWGGWEACGWGSLLVLGVEGQLTDGTWGPVCRETAGLAGSVIA